ncbi:MAG: outer membrane beta-barrel protein [Succinatimonas sp.]|nr:outer membrane beta-barrel protein [Succinatimonas sp.]MDY5721028.1 outer membrane beta-barrel protein [Succinivibrio sp.]
MKTKLLALAVAAAVSFSANAAVEDSWSFGAKAGWAHAFDHNNLELSDKNGYDLGLNGEYNFADWFALGADYDYKNGFKADDVKIHTNTVDMYGRFALPLDTNGSDIFFKVGPAYTWLDADGETYKKLGAIVGVGAQWAVNDSFAVRAGYDYLYKGYKENGDRADFGNLYLGAQFTFGAPAPVAPVAAPVEQKTVRVTEKHNLAAGLLFPFDGSKLSAEGKQAIADVVTSSKDLQNTEFAVYGYTDRIGSDAYNQTLSQKRADSVTTELQVQGVNTVTASEGRGKADPVTGNKCDSVKGRQAVIDCLAPDRRVEIVVTGDTTKVEQQ